MSETAIRAIAALALLAVASCQTAGSGPEANADLIGPVTFRCDDGGTIVATFDNAPTPATARMVRGDQHAVLPQAVSADGARYVGDDITFWNKGRDAMVDWRGTRLDCSTAE